MLASLPEKLLYARIDKVRSDEGKPLLMELEGIEPYLFRRDESEAAPLAAAIARRLR